MPYRSEPARRADGETRRSPTSALIRWCAALALVGTLLLAVPAVAAQRSVSDVVLVERGTVVDDDLYAAGNRIVVEGRVTGDLVVAAYEDVTITGAVEGDVIGLAGSVVVTGSVGESLRVASPSLRVDGEVGGDVVALAWDASLLAQVGGGAVVWSWSNEVGGVLEGDLGGQSRRLVLGGEVGGDVDVTVARLEIRPGTVVGRDLGYRSRNEAVGIDSAEVGGTVVHRLPLPANIRVRALFLLGKVVLGMMAAVTGLLVMWALPGAATRAIARVRRSWWRSWLRGISVALLPIVALALALVLLRLAPVEAAVPLLAVMLPVFLAILGLVLAFAFVAPAAVFPYIGLVGNRSRGPVRSFLYGALIVLLVALVPWMIAVVVLVVVPTGIGGWLATGSEPETV